MQLQWGDGGPHACMCEWANTTVSCRCGLRNQNELHIVMQGSCQGVCFVHTCLLVLCSSCAAADEPITCTMCVD